MMREVSCLSVMEGNEAGGRFFSAESVQGGQWAENEILEE